MMLVQPFPFCDEEEARMEPITVLGESLAGGRILCDTCRCRVCVQEQPQPLYPRLGLPL